MRGGSTLRLHSKLIIIVLLSAVVAALDASLVIHPRLLFETEEGEDRGETYGADALQFQLMKLRDGRGRIPPDAYGLNSQRMRLRDARARMPRDAYGRAKAHVDRLRISSALKGVESAAAPQ